MPEPVKRRLLFVDDDPHLLAGLKRILRPRRREWEMAFAQSGPDALSLLANDAFDAILTDFRMAGMSGLELLGEVKIRHPEVIRILFSGEVDQSLIMRSVRVAHQFISKPCAADALKQKIDQTFCLRHVLEDPALRAIVSKIDALPSLPALYGDIIAELRSPDASIKKVGRIIACDIAMASKILQLVNSAFFGLRQRITSPEQAALLLGLDTVKSLVLSVQIFTQFNIPQSFFPVITKLWRHSLNTGKLTKLIALREGLAKESVDHAFMAGLLHDCGKLVLMANFPGKMKTIISRRPGTSSEYLQLEQLAFGVTHGQVGAYLLGLWGLPQPIVDAICLHHTPGETPYDNFSALTAVHIANHMDPLPESPADENVLETRLDMAYLSRLGRAKSIETWLKIAEEAQPSEGSGRAKK